MSGVPAREHGLGGQLFNCRPTASVAAKTCDSWRWQPPQLRSCALRGTRASGTEDARLHAAGLTCWAGCAGCLLMPKRFAVLLVTNHEVFRGDYLVPKLPPCFAQQAMCLCKSRRKPGLPQSLPPQGQPGSELPPVFAFAPSFHLLAPGV